MCHKRRYISRREAAEFNPAKTGQPYRCKECSTPGHDVFHVGHKIRRKSRAEFYAQKVKERILTEYHEIFALLDQMFGIRT